MARPQALMKAVSANLNRFLQPISADLTKPQKKFLRDGLIGLLRAGRPVVCRMARELPAAGRQFLSCLEEHLYHTEFRSSGDTHLFLLLWVLWFRAGLLGGQVSLEESVRLVHYARCEAALPLLAEVDPTRNPPQTRQNGYRIQCVSRMALP